MPHRPLRPACAARLPASAASAADACRRARGWLADCGNAAAVAALSRISPELAALSTATTAVAAGPSTISSRCVFRPGRSAHHRCGYPPTWTDRSGPTERGHLGRFAQRAAHLDGGTCGAACVIVAVEEQQQRVAAELQQHAAVIVRDLDHRREYAAERFDEFLAARTAAQRQSLRKSGESGYVCEAQRSVDDAPCTVGFLQRPFDGEFGNVSA